MAINGVTTIGKSLTEATKLLQTAGDLVTLKIARPDKSLPSKLGGIDTLGKFFLPFLTREVIFVTSFLHIKPHLKKGFSKRKYFGSKSSLLG